MEGKRLIRFTDFKKEFGLDLSKSTVRRKVKDGEFPAPVKLSERVKAYVYEEVQDWVAAHIAEREIKAPRCDREGAAA